MSTLGEIPRRPPTSRLPRCSSPLSPHSPHPLPDTVVNGYLPRTCPPPMCPLSPSDAEGDYGDGDYGGGDADANYDDYIDDGDDDDGDDEVDGADD
eukprot:1284284-Pyramimonas_sp.AAC.1